MVSKSRLNLCFFWTALQAHATFTEFNTIQTRTKTQKRRCQFFSVRSRLIYFTFTFSAYPDALIQSRVLCTFQNLAQFNRPGPKNTIKLLCRLHQYLFSDVYYTTRCVWCHVTVEEKPQVDFDLRSLKGIRAMVEIRISIKELVQEEC